MIQKSIYIASLLLITLIFISCDPCKNLDCITDNYFGRFRIISKDNGNDLVFGRNAVYDQAKIKFYSLKGDDTTFFQYAPIKSSGSNYDSILHVMFYPETTMPVYMKLTELDIDTLLITYHTSNTKCCGVITEIAKFRYNNGLDIPGDQGTQELKK